jgi:hypothetical protein
MSGEFTCRASKHYGDAAMQKVLVSCKLCGKRMLSHLSPLFKRTCDACKAERHREENRKLAARRKAQRHAAKAALKPPRCQRCGKFIRDANRLNPMGNGRASSAATHAGSRLSKRATADSTMLSRIRIIKHEAVPDCGSFEVCFADGRVSQYSVLTICRAAGCGRRSLPASRRWRRPRHSRGLNAIRAP